jgi:hypothetical protein
MALNKVYTRINWEDYPSENTDIDEINLNKMDSAIDALDNRIILQDALKVDKSAINGNIADWTMDETTGVITITKYNGEKVIFDLNIEKIPVEFSMSDDGIITMTTEDGTQFTADIGSMIPVLTFEDSATIAVSVTGTGKNKTYSFSIKTGSVTDAMLQPNYLADIRVESANASAYAQSANAKSVLAKSYAIGGTGTREGEDTDNAKYYMEQAKQQTGGIPTKVSELENDAGYIKKDVDNLVNYYDKTTTDQKLANIDLTDYLKKTGDASNTTVTFTEPTELAQPTTGEKLGGIIGKVSLAIKNIKTLISLIGNTNISSIGDGTVTGAISDVNGKLAVQDASARLNPINGSLTYSQLRKYGKVVTISFRLTDCDIPYGTVICTLPEGYIPSTTWISIFGQVYDGSSWISGSITIDLGGNIRQEITQNNTKMCIFSGAFITD